VAWTGRLKALLFIEKKRERDFIVELSERRRQEKRFREEKRQERSTTSLNIEEQCEKKVCKSV
jgi:hypothetical protein